MPFSDCIVYVVDGDEIFSERMDMLAKSIGLRAEFFRSAEEFLRFGRPEMPGCLVLEVRLKGMSGLELQDKLAEDNIHIPIVFATGYSDVPMAVRAIKAGAAGFLPKPIREQDLIDAIHEALHLARHIYNQDLRTAALRERFDSLTQREKAVLGYLISGYVNKQIAAELGIPEATIKVHRTAIMHKMRANSGVDLARMATLLGLHAATPNVSEQPRLVPKSKPNRRQA